MNGQEVKSSEINLPTDVRHLAEVAKVVASPTERVELNSVLEGPQNTEDGTVFGPEKAVIELNQQSLSEAAISRVSRAVDAEPLKGLSPEVIAGAIKYVARIGELNEANRRQAAKTMTREDFDRAA